MKYIYSLIVIALCLVSSATAAEAGHDSTGQSYKSRLNFEPLLANPFEPRVGSMYQFGDKKLRLDIGNSIDMMKFGEGLAVGADFYTYTRLRSEGNFKFPVETSDYFFGINFSGKARHLFSGDFTNSFRLRLAHISSHLVDGLANDSAVFRRKPFVYSREFADLTGDIQYKYLRAYAGLSYVWATQPRTPERFIPQLGLEVRQDIYRGIEAFSAYDFKLVGISGVYTGVHAAQAGLIIPNSAYSALMLSLYAYQGRSMHGMFYNEVDSYLGLGFQVLF